MTREELKEKWLEALRSGEYEQGKGYLRKIDYQGVERFCCLGILCNLVDPGRWNPTLGKMIFRFGEFDSMPPQDVLNLLLLDAPAPKGYKTPEGGSIAEMLANLNDRGLTFDEIADIIEANILV